MTAAIVALLLSSTGTSGDELDRDPDFLAPFLGLTLLDAEDLARDSANPLEPSAEAEPSGPIPSAAPIWTAFIPSLSLELVHRQARLLSGIDVLGLRNGTILIVAATFGLPGEGRRDAPDGSRGPAGLRLALSRGVTAVSRMAPASLPAGDGGDSSAGPRASIIADVAELGPGLPSIAEIQEATERAALVRLEDLDGWRSRARASAWLPELGLSYQRNVGEIDTLGIQSNLGVDSHNIEDVARYGVRATWQLGQLIFSREEVAAAKTALEVQRDRQELVAHVTELYFEWLRLRARPPTGDEAAALKLAEVAAKIDALTGGFLSGRLGAAR